MNVELFRALASTRIDLVRMKLDCSGFDVSGNDTSERVRKHTDDGIAIADRARRCCAGLADLDSNRVHRFVSIVGETRTECTAQ